MAFILTSQLETNYKDENNIRHSIPIEDKNKILTNIKNFIKKYDKFVYVSNDPNNFDENEIKFVSMSESFHKTGLHFKENILLDSRNLNFAKEILQDADLIILSGGKCLCELEFFKHIHLKEILTNFKGLVISISAGTMNLCKTVANFPEENSDLDQPRWLEGLGFFSKIIIPHFDGKTKTYQIACEEIDVINDYVLPLSKEKEFIGMPNGSYILLDNNNVEYYGELYSIKNGKVKELKN